MDAGWSADPYGRAELRYHDGTAWTEHVATGGVTGVAPATSLPFSPPAPPPPVPSMPSVPAASILRQPLPSAPDRSGRLLAAGILTIIESVPAFLTGFWLLGVSRTNVGGLLNDASGGLITVLAAVVLAVAAGVLAAGIGSCARRSWARITTVVLQSLFGAFWIYAGINALRSPDAQGSVGGTLTLLAVMLGWVGTTLFLAVTGQAGRHAEPTMGRPSVVNP